MNHHVIVRNRAISVVGPVMVQSNVAVDTVTVTVDSEYDGLQVALVIGGTQIMYDGEPVTVPSSELERAGDLPLTVLGLSSGKRVVTASAESAFRVVASGAFEGEDPVPDSPDMLQQLADAYKAANEAAGTATEAAKAAQDAVAKVDEAVSDLGDAAANAAAARESAEAAAKSASDAKASESSARASAESASSDAGSASSSATAARQSATEAASSATDAKASADLAAGWVPADGEPGQLLAKTDSGTAWVDPPSTGNVLTGEAEGYVAHAEDAYAAKPREVRVKGRTVKNLWPAINSTSSGITVSTDETGLITVSGTKTTDTTIYLSVYDVLSAGNGTQLTALRSRVSNVVIPYVNTFPRNASVIGFPSSSSSTSTSGTIPNDDAKLRCGIRIGGAVGTQVDASFRVMLVEGTEAPDCFTPPGLNSVQTGNLVTAGKNLLARIGPSLPYTYAGITFSDNGDGGIRVSGTATSAAYYNFFTTSPAQALCITPGEYAASLVGGVSGLNLSVGYYDGEIGAAYTSWLATNKPGVSSTGSIDRPVYLRPFLSVANGKTVDTVVYPQLEPGSTATAYEPPDVTTTPLPEVGLRSLPDGTCDELVIGADGTCEVERRTQLTGDEVTALPEPTTETLDAVSLPKLPAPTFNIYHDSQVPSDTSVEYERDVNIAYAELEAKIAALTVAQATS